MCDMLQGIVSDAFYVSKLQIEADGRKYGYLVEKQVIYTYGDVIFGLDNLSGYRYKVIYHIKDHH